MNNAGIKNALVSSGTTKRSGRPRETALDDRRILSLLNINPFTTVDQIKNTGHQVSKSTINPEDLPQDVNH